ncbi:hypothetical protein HAZT_HAZT002216 [Hyalella azteca]|uniref:Lipase domain-containing protein n=1 Tax=Hyalella azteca TaxID=294128 RepID=A0A6A0HC27_HYAAZ|nr:hypothetical protein HAZT_HAZT002216 [Hyalella azteca]
MRTVIVVILAAVLSSPRHATCTPGPAPPYTSLFLSPVAPQNVSFRQQLSIAPLSRGLTLTPAQASPSSHGDEQQWLPKSQDEAKRTDRKLFNKNSKKNLVGGIQDDELYSPSNLLNDTESESTKKIVVKDENFQDLTKSTDYDEVGTTAEQFYLQELEQQLQKAKEVRLDRIDLRTWKQKLLKAAGDDVGLHADLSGFMQALSSAKDAPESGYETTLLARPEPSTNFITEDLVPSMDSTSKMSVHSSREVTSAEVRDMALKRWLKSSSAAISSDEAERRKIEELSYKILSLADPEEESKDEANDREIYKAVFTSVAAYQIRKLQRKLRNGRVKRDEEMVCYKDLGCFRDDGAFDYLDVLPSPPEEINTKFLLFTRKNPEAAQIFDPNNATSMQASNFDAESLTKVIVHGFGSSCHRVWVREMRAALLTMVDVNLICVDWENGATVPNYMRAASNTRLVGRQVGRMVESLMKATNTSLDKFHLIGFSLGAHVSGHAGKKLKFKRISGLDPAGPLFENFPPSVRLDSSDAEFVDVIHTNADSLIRGGLGAYQAMGHVDFYPNGGRMQKGCTNLFVGGVSDILWRESNIKLCFLFVYCSFSLQHLF